jgi:hypothetical protein
LTAPVYDLPIWAHDLEEFPPRGIVGKGWRLGARQVQFRNHDEKEAHFLEMREKYTGHSITYIDSAGNEYQRVAPQLFVEAKSRVMAQRVCDLLSAALCALDGNDIFVPGGLLAAPNDRTKLEDINKDILKRYGNNQLGRRVLLAARLAAKCSRYKPLQYALHKLDLSFQLACADVADLDPANAEKHFGVVSDRKAHVALASAVTLAYSVIEELQLEPRPVGKDKPVKVGRVWNPDAFDDLTVRLEKAGINLKEKLNWTVRGQSDTDSQIEPCA